MAFVVLAQHVTLFTSCKRIRFSGPGDFARLQHLYTTLVVVGLTGMHKTSCSGESRLPLHMSSYSRARKRKNVIYQYTLHTDAGCTENLENVSSLCKAYQQFKIVLFTLHVLRI